MEQESAIIKPALIACTEVSSAAQQEHDLEAQSSKERKSILVKAFITLAFAGLTCFVCCNCKHSSMLIACHSLLMPGPAAGPG